MSANLDVALVDRIAAVLAEIAAVEAARVPIADEIAAEVGKLDQLAARAEGAAPGAWLSINPSFNSGAFSDSVLAFGMAIAPDRTREVVAARAKVRADAWAGLRMTEDAKQRKLTKLRNDLRTARATLEQRRREIEAQTNDVLPRVNDDPSIWLLPPDALDKLAATSNARAK